MAILEGLAIGRWAVPITVITTADRKLRWTPYKAPCKVTAPMPRADYLPSIVSVEMTDLVRFDTVSKGVDPSRKTKKMSTETLNAIYTAYQPSPEAERGNLEAAIFAYARMNNRPSQCVEFLKDGAIYVQADDILNDFALDILKDIDAGKYESHTGILDHWINMLWTGFFKDFKKAYTRKDNQESPVTEYGQHEDPDGNNTDDAADEFIFGRVNRREVEFQQVAKDARETAGMVLDKRLPLIWDQLSDTAKVMINARRKGATNKVACSEAGVSDRQGLRIMKKVREIAISAPNVEVVQ